MLHLVKVLVGLWDFPVDAGSFPRARAELTAAQRTKYTKRREQIWDALHPESNTQRVALLESAINSQVAQAAPPEKKPIGNKSPPPQTKGFAAATAKATGQTKRTTNRNLARADAIGDDNLDKLTNTSLDSAIFVSVKKTRYPESRAFLRQLADAMKSEVSSK